MLTITSNNFYLYSIKDGNVVCRKHNYEYDIVVPILKYVDKNTNEVFVVDGVKCEITPTYSTLDRKGKDGIESDISGFRDWLTFRDRPKVKQEDLVTLRKSIFNNRITSEVVADYEYVFIIKVTRTMKLE